MDLFGFEDDLDLQDTNIVPCDSAPSAIPQKDQNRERNESLTISQIQEILRHELEADKSATVSVDGSVMSECTEQSIQDSTLFEEPSAIDETLLRPRAQPKRQAAKKVKYKEHPCDSEIDSTIKPKRNPKKKLPSKKENEQPQQEGCIRREAAKNDDRNNAYNDENEDPNILSPTKTTKKGLQARNENIIPVSKTYDVRKNVKAVKSNIADLDTSIVKRKRNTRKKKGMLEEDEDVQHKMEEINNQFKAVEEYALVVEK